MRNIPTQTLSIRGVEFRVSDRLILVALMMVPVALVVTTLPLLALGLLVLGHVTVAATTTVAAKLRGMTIKSITIDIFGPSVARTPDTKDVAVSLGILLGMAAHFNTLTLLAWAMTGFPNMFKGFEFGFENLDARVLTFACLQILWAGVLMFKTIPFGHNEGDNILSSLIPGPPRWAHMWSQTIGTLTWIVIAAFPDFRTFTVVAMLSALRMTLAHTKGLFQGGVCTISVKHAMVVHDGGRTVPLIADDFGNIFYIQHVDGTQGAEVLRSMGYEGIIVEVDDVSKVVDTILSG